MVDDRFRKALDEMTAIADAIQSGTDTPLRAANNIYWVASGVRAWDDDAEGPMAEQCAAWGSEFLQLADSLELYQDDPDRKAAWEALIKHAARAYLGGLPFPEYKDDGSGLPQRSE